MGSRGSCQIGGNIATNAGGLNVIKYGTIRQNILGIEAVLPDGRIYSSLKNVKKISEILNFCQKKSIGVVPQGGNTGLVGGSVPTKKGNEIIINLSNLNKIRNIDLVGNSVTVESGCILDIIKNCTQRIREIHPYSFY